MKRILTVSAVMTVALALATPAMAGRSDHRRGHGYRIVRTAGVHVGVFGYPHQAYYRPRTSFHLSIGVPFLPYYYAPAPVYYSPVPVIVAPAPCGFFVTGHYVRGHRPRSYYEDDEDYDD